MYKHRVLFKIPNPFHRPGDFFSTLLSVHLTTNEYGLKGYSPTGTRWAFEIMFGTGAGYIWGRTLFLAHALPLAQGAKYRRDFPWPFWEHMSFGKMFNRPAWQMGFTQCAPRVPYVDGM
jgi:hypothetical protein